MKELDVWGVSMALEHVTFQMVKKPPLSVLVITPKMDLISRVNSELYTNLLMLSDPLMLVEYRTKASITLYNQSSVYFMSSTSGGDHFHGYSFNMVVSTYEKIPKKIARIVFPRLACTQESVIYNVYDRINDEPL